ncbi:hypothetical protein [Usitatibacter palustris]|uniref:Uncharacterized protein n=1 Tax=Usitatibacter palustris TaxID=2732487 RepID=A0A6M4H1Z6_9PROT|nr:hypothetical protein [Usitatibacter palustris]QJR13480.1 hypothetical protein DSM104440_00264 [Usitatibacter palustris]
MKYWLGIGLVFVMQVIVTYVTAIIPTNGSFLGLGNMLLGVMGIPITALGNWALIKSKPEKSTAQHVIRSFFIGLLLPAAQVGIVILWKVTGI